MGDVVSILAASAVDDRLADKTVSVLGPTELSLSEAMRRVARATGRSVWVAPLPVRAHYALALPGCDVLPADLQPKTPFDTERILESF